MKKKIIRFFSGVLLLSASFTLVGCIDETEPTSGLTQDQVDESSNTIEALLQALPAKFNKVDARTGNFGDYAFGYGSVMHVRDVETGDMAITYSAYDHFQPWETNEQMGPSMARTQWLWNYPYECIMAANKLISAVKNDSVKSNTNLAAEGIGYAFRALFYLDLAREFEFLPNEKTSGVNSNGNDVTNLTVPIITDETTEEDIKNNPRVSREVMYNFIHSDLEKAQNLIVYNTSTAKDLPHLDAVYGLKARLFMWVEKYDSAAIYSAKAIQAASNGTAITTLEDCFTISGNNLSGYSPTCFNTSTKWMWAVEQTSENSTVTSGILNWTSWMSPNASFGYAVAGPAPCIDMNMYNRINSADWRKLFYNSEDLVSPGISYKFQPNEGNTSVANIGAAVAYPVMRIEEMYFIQAEAYAHINAQQGKTILESFMNNYRVGDLGGTYTCNATTQDGIIEEIIFQKRVELWGEGQTFFDIKRLNYSVTRGYDGTNFFDEARLNTNGRPAWMNWCIVQTEENSNSALVGWNNPDPTDKYTPWNE